MKGCSSRVVSVSTTHSSPNSILHNETVFGFVCLITYGYFDLRKTEDLPRFPFRFFLKGFNKHSTRNNIFVFAKHNFRKTYTSLYVFRITYSSL